VSTPLPPPSRRRLSIAVVQGGPSSEAEVSRASATSVARALESSGHRVVRLELDGYLADTLRTGGFDVVFPVAHGAVGEDGSLQGLLEVMDLPYVGSGVLASALAMNKRVAKQLFAAAGLPIAPGIAFTRRSERARGPEEAAERAIAELGPRLVVKPCSSGSAIGVSRFDDHAEVAALAKAIEAAWHVDETALVERFVKGREVTCGVLDVDPATGPVAFPPTEIRSPKDAFYTYEARYAPGRSEHVCPAPLDPRVTERVQEVAKAAHLALGCRDLSRVDFVVGETPSDVVLLEVNTMPGFTDTSLYPEAAAVHGLSMPELTSALALCAARRGAPRRNPAIPLPR
jgi:D-alanine-D-alanine ligase